ncbi:hypothetical protein ONZ45_g10775 [Pleurotus djamor]|nr:hypothetical protein ONZ45_g10775 [Pleurotus djamor]
MEHTANPNVDLRVVPTLQDVFTNFTNSVPTHKYDDQYYFTFIVFSVEGVLFKVPRHKFESESPIFLSMFELPPEGLVDGLSDEQPLRLDGIECNEFRDFLKTIARPAALTAREWTSVLKLASLWDMANIRKDAIHNLDSLILNPAEKVGIAIDYDIEAWLVPSLNALVQREQPISPADLSFIGIDCALKIAAIREACQRSGSTCYYCSSNGTMSLQTQRGSVSVDCRSRIETDLSNILNPPSLRDDKAITARELRTPRKPKFKKTRNMREASTSASDLLDQA